ncbi:hypothetical protein diail_1132 [Diaporthe ilicicola]|nr:hypothetical protein diail_1132 [Diaporthe ilicicola]
MTQLGLSLHEVKRRARNIERRFAKGDDLPADVQQKLELELEQCKKEIDEVAHRKKRQDMISKYHRVRFFERKKAERLRKKLKKQADEATDPEEKARIEADLHIADVDYHYTRYFPFLERYESLYTAPESPKEDDADGQPAAMRALHSERPPMWKVVEEAMGHGEAALMELQERRPEKTQGHQPEKTKPEAEKRTTEKPSKSSSVGEPAPPPRAEEKRRLEAKISAEGNRRTRRAKGIFNDKGPAGSGEDGTEFFV